MSFVNDFIKKHPAKYIKINNTIGKYIVGGKQKTGLIILPGGGQDMYSSYDFIDAYEGKYKVISISINGFRKLSDFFEFINKILETEKVDKIILYGLSLGGFLAQHYIRLYQDRVLKLILSHTSSTRSKALIHRIIIPGKIAYFFLPIIPLRLLKFLVKKNSGKIQSGSDNVMNLWNKYSSKENLSKRTGFIKKFGLDFIDREYLKSFYSLGIEMEKTEKLWKQDDMVEWSKNILIIKTTNDPLAIDDGVLKQYYPKAKEFVFYKTGHLTPFIRFEEMKQIIDSFI